MRADSSTGKNYLRHCYTFGLPTSCPVNAFCKMDWRRRVARWSLADTTISISSTTLNRRSTSATIRVCSASGGSGMART